MRVSRSHIEFELKLLNQAMGTPEAQFSEDGVFNVGNIHTYDGNIVQTRNTAGGIAILARCKTKREIHSHLQAMTQAVSLARR